MNKYKFRYQRIDPIFEIAKSYEHFIYGNNMFEAMEKWNEYKKSDLYHTGDEIKLIRVDVVTSNVLEVTRWIIEGD